MAKTEIFDLFIIGGGINGTGIARDAAGRGYKVALAEMNDFGSATSAASTKLFHGGLRYLEYFEFRLVREALIEREILLKAMPHICWPMRFVLPVHRDMRFENDTPVSKFLSFFMPFMKGRRPAWLIRLGLFFYDHMGGRKILAGTSSLELANSPEGEALDDKYRTAYEYSDCWVEDSRLTLLNAIDAQNHGTTIFARTKFVSASQKDGIWYIATKDENDKKAIHQARMIVNAGGPWVKTVIDKLAGLQTKESVRLVRGSHIVVKMLYDHDKAYFFQGRDGRIMFAIPYEEDFTLLGTTDAEHEGIDVAPACSDEEADYMIAFVNEYFKADITRNDIVWSYSGVRPLYDDGAGSPSAATRDYVLRLNNTAGAPVLNIFGGKITTYRKLAGSALEKIDNALGRNTKNWTGNAPLPGGDIGFDEIDALRAQLADQLPFFDAFTLRRLVRQYGTQALAIFDGVTKKGQLGEDFSHGVFAHEIKWAIKNEFVRCAEDFLWRRSKMGLRFDARQTKRLDAFIKTHQAAT